MFHSAQTEYAIRGLVYLASEGPDRPLLARDVARKIHIRRQIVDYLKRITLGDLAEAIRQKQALLTLEEERRGGEN